MAPTSPSPKPLAVSESLRKQIRPATLIESVRLNDRLGTRVTLASETFQHTGSFKFRAAYSVASQVPNEHLLTASSGNFGQALAYACRLLGKRCTVIMPVTSAQVKIDAVRSHGAEVELLDVTTKTRTERLEELSREFPEAYSASPYDDPLVISGNATLADELLASGIGFDAVLAPVGGGGLSSGLVSGFQAAGSGIAVFGAEPLMANDAARSLREGRLIPNDSEPQTIADGARTLSLGQRNWKILKDGLAGMVEVPEENIAEAVRLLYSLANLKAEPTGALTLGAVLTAPDRFRDQRVCCIVSGGNVDPAVYTAILASTG